MIVKSDLLKFVNSLVENDVGKVEFVLYEILDTKEKNTRRVILRKETITRLINNHFDDELHGNFNDDVMTTIIGFNK